MSTSTFPSKVQILWEDLRALVSITPPLPENLDPDPALQVEVARIAKTSVSSTMLGDRTWRRNNADLSVGEISILFMAAIYGDTIAMHLLGDSFCYGTRSEKNAAGGLIWNSLVELNGFVVPPDWQRELLKDLDEKVLSRSQAMIGRLREFHLELLRSRSLTLDNVGEVVFPEIWKVFALRPRTWSYRRLSNRIEREAFDNQRDGDSGIRTQWRYSCHEKCPFSGESAPGKFFFSLERNWERYSLTENPWAYTHNDYTEQTVEEKKESAAFFFDARQWQFAIWNPAIGHRKYGPLQPDLTGFAWCPA